MKKILSLMLLCAAVTFASCSKDEEPVPVPVTGVTLNKTDMRLTKGFKETLVATISPENADNKELGWFSSNTSVATVSETGEVTAVSPGTAIIVAGSSEGAKMAACNVTVTPPSVSIGLTSDVYSINEYAPGDKAEIVIPIATEMAGDITCIVKATDETAVSTGDNWDYKLTSTQIKIEKGSKEGKVIISLKDHMAQKEDRTFKLEITAVSSDCANEEVKLDATSTECQVTIKKVAREATFLKSSITASKQTSPIDLSLCLTAPVGQDVTITIAPMSGGTAKENVDYKLASHQVTIKAGQTVSSIKMEILNDVNATCNFEIIEVTGNVDVAMNAYCQLKIQKAANK